MALITLIRHAKTEPGHVGQRDFERNLLARGRQDSLKVALWCKDNLPPADIWLVSPANRTRETAQILASHWQMPAREQHPEALYGADAPDILTLLEEVLVSEAAAENAHVLLIGHNPGISVAAGELGATPAAGHFPTGGLGHFYIAHSAAHDLRGANSECLSFVTPKGLPTPD